MTNRQMEALETRRKLLEAGKRIMTEKGMSNTCVEEITEAAGVSKGTFYTYFRRKEELVFELSRHRFDKILAKARESSGAFPDKLKIYLVNFSRLIEEGGARLAQDWVKSVVSPAGKGQYTDRGKLGADIASLEELFRSGMDAGQLAENTPVKQLSETLADLLYGEMLCWSMSDGSYSLQERTGEFCRAYLNGMLQAYILN